MRTKLIFTFLLIGLLISKSIDIFAQDNPSDTKIILTLRSFYKDYITERSKMPEDFKKIDFIKNKYCTKNLLIKLDKLTKQGMNIDPFIKAQDWDDDLLTKMDIKKDNKSQNIYNASYLDNYRKTSIIVKLKVINQNNTYLIDDILDL
jgi:hypothetical protein